MNRNVIQIGAMVSLLAAMASAPAVALAQHRCDDPNGTMERRACAKAAEGNDALRRFVARTQGIWNLYYYEYARPDPADVATAAAITPHASTAAQAGNVTVAAQSR